MKISCASEAASHLRPKFKHMAAQESFVVALLDAQHHVLKSLTVALGTVNYVHLHPRDVFREAIRYNAVSIILAHNHPSGELLISTEDVAVTERMVKAGEILGIEVLDSLIITATTFISVMGK